MGGLTPPAEVLEKSGRRCCLYYGLYGDLEVKRGQIAHLDHNYQNNNIDNLAFLCLKHHDEYDSRTSQSKGWTITEAKRYRTMLYKEIEVLRQAQQDHTTTLDLQYKPLIFGKIAPNLTRYVMDALDRNTGHTYEIVPSFSILYSASLIFDVTNPNQLDIRLLSPGFR
jgi:hypothetical protein